MRRLFAIAAVLCFAIPASAGTHTDKNWSTKPSGAGNQCDLIGQGSVCYYNAVTDEADSPVLVVGPWCGQIFTQFWELTVDAQVDIDFCNVDGTNCNTHADGSNLAASGIGPEGGVAAAIKVMVETCTTCELEVEVKCGA